MYVLRLLLSLSIMVLCLYAIVCTVKNGVLYKNEGIAEYKHLIYLLIIQCCIVIFY